MKVPRYLWFAACSIAAAASTALGAEGWTKYNSQPGTNNLIRIEGTSTIHDWTVESRIIGGAFEAGPSFATDAAKAKAGPVEAKATIYIPVRSLKSVKDGKPYSNAMDDVMYKHLIETQHKQIRFELSEIVLKEVPSGSGPFTFDTKGKLAVAGVTNDVAFPVEMTVDGNRLKFTGNTSVKMTDFKVEPPSPTMAGGLIKTGDDVKLSISWAAVKKP